MRVEFSITTKRLLAHRAGLLCSHYDCLRPTVTPAKNQKGEEGAVGTGVAAHIYAASEKGPRPPDGMSEDQIRDQSNGTWMCRLCSNQIDDFRWNYPPEKVLEMKRVREFAQFLTVTQSDASYLIGWMGVKRFDRIVRDHLPELDAEEIRLSIIDHGKKFVGENLVMNSEALMAPPDHFIKRALPKMVREGERELGRVQPAPRLVIEQQWVKDIAREFNKEFYDVENFTAEQINNGQICLRARCPVTGQLSEAAYHARADISCKHDPFGQGGKEIKFQVVSRSGAEWRYFLSTEIGNTYLSSRMTLENFPLPAITDGLNQSRREFEGYAGWIDALRNGFHPVGQIGLRPTDFPSGDSLHPGIFEITQDVHPSGLAAAAEFCARVRLAYEFADKLNLSVALNRHLFDARLNVDSIREAMEELSIGYKWMSEFESGPIVTFNDGKWGFVLSKKIGGISITPKRLVVDPPAR